MILVDLDSVTMTRPGRALFRDLSLTIADSDRLGVVGINGTGKSTLLRVLSGSIEPESGTVRRGRDVRIAELAQRPRLRGSTLREAFAAGADDGTDRSWESLAIADRLGLTPLLDSDIEDLSGGELKRAALVEVLVTPSDLLVLDEPTNHLDIDSIAWLEDRLAAHRGGLVMVTHDRHFLDRVTNRILELDRGATYLHEGGYASYLEGRAQRQEAAEAAERKRRNLARTELAWLRRGAPARTAKPKARIQTARATIDARMPAEARTGQLPLHGSVPRLGDKVIELRDVSIGHPGREPLIEHLDLLLDNRERLGIVGPNGAGKSTLLDVMAGVREPLSGTVEVGSTVRVGYYDQVGRELDPRQRVRDAVAGDKGEVDWTDKALMEAFWFDGDAQWAPIELLSGGERRRLQLLLTLADKPNVLFLDEPTNDLDLDTLRELEDFLEEWPGALVVVSHDRAFLERTVTDVIVVDGTGTARRWPGGYAAYEQERRNARRRDRVGSAAVVDGPGAATPGDPGSVGSVTALDDDTTSPAVVRSDGPRDGDVGRGGPGPADTTTRRPSASTVRFRLKAAEKELRVAQRTVDDLRRLFEENLDDHVRLGEIAARVAEAEEELARREETWLELAESAEEWGMQV